MAKTIVLDAKGVEKLGQLAEKLAEQKPFEIISATFKDALCNYGYEVMTGPNKGDIISSRKGAHFVHEDLEEAFQNLDVFLAHIDGAFNSWAINQTHLSELEEKEELGQYHVSTFKIVGVEENKSVILSGTKHTVHGDISFATPKIKLNGTYLYLEELELRLNVAISEVEGYMAGKKAPELEQTAMNFDSFEQEDDAFENAKVN